MNIRGRWQKGSLKDEAGGRGRTSGLFSALSLGRLVVQRVGGDVGKRKSFYVVTNANTSQHKSISQPLLGS